MAQVKTIPFATFEDEFINAPWGYLPVDLGITETDDGEFVQSILLEMICRWRLRDGKILFLTVTFDTPEQLEAILEWTRKAAAQLASEIVGTVDRMPNYSQHIQWKPEIKTEPPAAGA